MGVPVLVTGGSGFLGSAVIVALLQAGHEVRTTVRDLRREADVRALVRAGGVEAGDRLTFAAADLERDEGWAEAVAGCAFVHHVASPFPPGAPRHEDELVIPAREGALRVLRAARAAGVQRVVLTSSFAAVGYGHPAPPERFDETWWSDPAAGISAYAKSKTLAERAAWDFVKDGGPELAVVNPVGIFGPVLGPDTSTSILLVKRLLDGMPGCPRLWFGVVDVRDVADLHLRCQTNPAAAGERFLCTAGDFLTIREIALLLKSRLGDRGARIPTREFPDWLVRVFGFFDPGVGLLLPELGKKKSATNAKARERLGWSPRTAADALVATAESLLELGLVRT